MCNSNENFKKKKLRESLISLWFSTGRKKRLQMIRCNYFEMQSMYGFGVTNQFCNSCSKIHYWMRTRTVKHKCIFALCHQNAYLRWETKQSTQLLCMCVCFLCLWFFHWQLIGIVCQLLRVWPVLMLRQIIAQTMHKHTVRRIFDPNSLSHSMQIRRFNSLQREESIVGIRFTAWLIRFMRFWILWGRYTMQLIEIIFVAWQKSYHRSENIHASIVIDGSKSNSYYTIWFVYVGSKYHFSNRTLNDDHDDDADSNKHISNLSIVFIPENWFYVT